uniref:Uncharacterized protein n=1 Tax=Daphnia galeata TaxID=27404 RepID=A0A8J2RPY6_9CRUS|nr:unnamed protein product [Daphnia galeata]
MKTNLLPSQWIPFNVTLNNRRIFFHETSGDANLNFQQCCVVESAAKHNPDRPVQRQLAAISRRLLSCLGNWIFHQLSMEVHLEEIATLEQHVLWAKLLRTNDKMGMVRFDFEYNPWYKGNFTLFSLSASLGYEIAWYNSNLTRHLS